MHRLRRSTCRPTGAARALAVAACAAALLAATGRPSAGQADPRPFAITGVRVFDGALALDGETVLVRDGTIVAVGKDVTVPEGFLTIDGRGHTLLPGLIDAHTHAIYTDHLRRALVFGVTTELDMFTSVRQAEAIQAEQRAGGNPGMADLFSAGTLVTAPGGHGTEYGLPIPTLAGPEEADAFVAARIEEGADYIKIVYDDRGPEARPYPSIGRATLEAVVRAAHERGRLAVVHATRLEAARHALEAGADGLVHVFADRPPAPGFGRSAKEAGLFVIPTLTVLEGVTGEAGGASVASDPRLAPWLSPAVEANLRRAFPPRPGGTASFAAALETVRRLEEAGVPILAGTDAPNPGTAHGASIHRELELLVRAGLTPLEALAAATSAPARAFGLEDRGRIAPGRRADLLLVRGDPTADIRATRDIAGVWKLGVPADREGWRAAALREREEGRGRSPSPAPAGTREAVSDFDGGELGVRFGTGWVSSTDSIAGGGSTAGLAVVDGGAAGSAGALEVEGRIEGDLPFAWAGAMYFPGATPMEPADLSEKEALAFWARGDGGTYRVMLFTRRGGSMPAIREFVAGSLWQRFEMPLSDFGTDGSDLAGVLFAGGPAPGPFSFRIDEVGFR